ncbi:autotransporter-associated beta strand repeat-containing protein, partial [Rhizobiaceae sp. 2RAB30]
LSGGSTLNMQFGQANVSGGALNDLVNVGGDLVLDGTLNVSVTAGGSFGAGIYRVINYSGSLTHNGLSLGAMPTGEGVFVQTSVAGQVNLVNGSGLTLNYWDGAAGPKFDHRITGGDGTWQNSIGNDNWTETGIANAPFEDAAFAVFMGAADIVTVDGTLGTVNASGMQFVTNGYRIQGDAINLVGAPSSVIRVGDGTTAGAAVIATIASNLMGGSQLVKSDLGTLILTGNNGYSGGTAINGGTLRVAADANLGAASGGLDFAGGTLETTADMAMGRAVTLTGAGTLLTAAGTTLTSSGTITGSGALTKRGAGALILTGNASHSGGTTVAAGILQIGNGGGNGSIAGNVVNNGAVVFNRTGSIAYAGDMSGTGSLRKSGTGTLTMTGSNTYGGTTVVGAGSLNLQAGGRIVGTSSLTIADTAGVAAAAVVDGSGARIVAAGDSSVGSAGSGTLSVRNGGSASFAGLDVAVNSGSSGTVDIIGSGSEVTTSGSPTQSIGFGGTATL